MAPTDPIFDENGNYADPSDPWDEGNFPPLDALLPSDVIAGQRVRFTADWSHVITNYEITIPAGSLATVREISQEIVGDPVYWLTLDDHYEDLIDWDNDLIFDPEQDGPDYWPSLVLA